VTADPATPLEHLVSVVVPVYQGEKHLPALLAEIAESVEGAVSPDGTPYRVVETLLVHDRGPDRSDRVMRELAEKYPFVRTVWLSRNYGQHAATLAGMASSGGEWIVTMDEDGQHDPRDIGVLLDAALESGSSLVYARPENRPPHSAFRNGTSRAAKWLVNKFSGGADASVFHSYRLVLGEVGRSVAAYAGAGVYLDIALSWVVGTPVTAPVSLRDEGERRSGYSLRSLMSHFWRMVLTGGTRGLRAVSALGAAFATVGLLIAVGLVVNKLVNPDAVDIRGWTSLVVVILVCTGAVLFSLGVIAEYIGVAVNMAMGRPPYLITSDPESGPLGRARRRDG
jgi:undecaprenyl-phosphate 4-deoxy-4-formamido-L-arabinose transferase